MARIYEPTPEQEAGYREWVASRPDVVRKVAEKFEPWSLYRMKNTGNRVTLVSFGEEENGGVSLTVNISADYNAITFERQVFGVSPDNLEPCDLPMPNEPLGALFTEREDIDAFIDEVRPIILANKAN